MNINIKSVLSCIFLTLCIVFSSNNLYAQKFSKSVNKKIDKRLAKLFPEQDLILSFYDSIDYDSSNYDDFTNLKLAKVESLDSCIAYIFFNSSRGKVEFFDYMIIFDKELKIINATILVYRSSHGGQVNSRSWLKQFIGKTNGENIELENDIDTITGATLSVESLTYGISDLSILLYNLNERGALD